MNFVGTKKKPQQFSGHHCISRRVMEEEEVDKKSLQFSSKTSE